VLINSLNALKKISSQQTFVRTGLFIPEMGAADAKLKLAAKLICICFSFAGMRDVLD
jgi:hypothetical protein